MKDKKKFKTMKDIHKEIEANKGYKCTICGRKYKSFSNWILKHFSKKHKDEKTLKLTRL